MIIKKLVCECNYTKERFEVEYAEVENMWHDPLKYQCCPCCGEQSYTIVDKIEFSSFDINNEYPKSKDNIK